jgi:hypothetical protein
MSSSELPCTRPEREHVRKFVAYAKSCLNESWIYPPVNSYRYLVALALYSKCITVAEATLALVDAGFSDEAFAMTRTLIDIAFTLHFIANKETEERARRYAQFTAKDSEVWTEVTKTYWPQRVQPLEERTQKLAASYRSPHQWSGLTTKEMALEPDTTDADPVSGLPFVRDFDYYVVFRWASHYVHPTIGSLGNHLIQAGRDNFIVRSGKGKDMNHMTLFNVALYLGHTMIYFYRCMEDPQPERLSNWAGALIKHVARRHN